MEQPAAGPGDGADPRPAAVRPRKVFGRVRVSVGGKECTVTMTKTSLEVRPLNSRKVWRAKLAAAGSWVLAFGKWRDE